MRLRLVAKTPEEVRGWIEQADPEIRAELSPDWLARVRSATSPDPWTMGFAVLLRSTDIEIGSCGFKGPPHEGLVEIAYGINPAHQNNGYATEAAGALVAFASGSGEVRVVRAHTWEEANASARVLVKCGFRLVGQVFEPEDGMVWRWETSLESRLPDQAASATSIGNTSESATTAKRNG